MLFFKQGYKVLKDISASVKNYLVPLSTKFLEDISDSVKNYLFPLSTDEDFQYKLNKFGAKKAKKLSKLSIALQQEITLLKADEESLRHSDDGRVIFYRRCLNLLDKNYYKDKIALKKSKKAVLDEITLRLQNPAASFPWKAAAKNLQHNKTVFSFFNNHYAGAKDKLIENIPDYKNAYDGFFWSRTANLLQSLKKDIAKGEFEQKKYASNSLSSHINNSL